MAAEVHPEAPPDRLRPWLWWSGCGMAGTLLFLGSNQFFWGFVSPGRMLGPGEGALAYLFCSLAASGTAFVACALFPMRRYLIGACLLGAWALWTLALLVGPLSLPFFAIAWLLLGALFAKRGWPLQAPPLQSHPLPEQRKFSFPGGQQPSYPCRVTARTQAYFQRCATLARGACLGQGSLGTPLMDLAAELIMQRLLRPLWEEGRELGLSNAEAELGACVAFAHAMAAAWEGDTLEETLALREATFRPLLRALLDDWLSRAPRA